MALTSISAGVWTSVTTTAATTLFQNRSGSRTMYLTTEDTTGLALDDGIEVSPGMAVEITTGKNVSACFVGGSGTVYYGEV